MEIQAPFLWKKERIEKKERPEKKERTEEEGGEQVERKGCER